MTVAREETFRSGFTDHPVPQHRRGDSNFQRHGVRSVERRLYQSPDYITRFISELDVGTVNVREVPGYRPN